MTRAHLDTIEAIVESDLSPLAGYCRDLLGSLAEARAAAIALGEAMSEEERELVLPPVQVRYPWLVLFGEEKDHGEAESSDPEQVAEGDVRTAGGAQVPYAR